MRCGWLLALIASGGYAAACSFDTTPKLPSQPVQLPIDGSDGGPTGGDAGLPGAGRSSSPPSAGRGGSTAGAAGMAGTGTMGSAGDSGAGGAGRPSDGGSGSAGSGGTAGSESAGRGGSGGRSGKPPEPEFCERPENDGALCNDELFCTTGERCSGGLCQGGTPTDCSGIAGDQCNTGICDPISDSCVQVPVADGTPCADAIECTTSELCLQGECTPFACAPASTCDMHCGADCACHAVHCEQASKCHPVCGSGNTCAFHCAGTEECKVRCEQNAACNVDCTDADSCVTECGQASACQLKCTGGNCRAKCAAGSFCDIDCTAAGDCTEIECETGAVCVLHCGDNPNCGFKRCSQNPGGGIVPTDCGNGVLACPACLQQ